MSDSTPDSTPADVPAEAGAALPPQPPAPGPSAPSGAPAPGAPATGAKPFLRRTGVKVAGAAVAAVLLLGGGFGAGWAAASTRMPAVPAGWDRPGDLPGSPGDDSGRQGGPREDFHHGGPGSDGDQDGDSDSGSGTGTDGS